MKKWYVVNTKPHQEQKGLDNLLMQGFDAWLPTFKKSVRHARKIVTKNEALFPGYLFVSFDIDNKCWVKINSTFGVKMIVGNESPQAISANFIKDLKDNLEGGTIVAGSEYVVGDEIKIISGSFTNSMATIKKLLPRERVEILLAVLGGNITTLMQTSAIIPAR